MRHLLPFLLVTLVAAQQIQPEEEVAPQPPPEETVHVGELRGSEHGIAGSLYAVDDNILVLKRFEYDGEAKDPFFWVGTSGVNVIKTCFFPFPDWRATRNSLFSFIFSHFTTEQGILKGEVSLYRWPPV